MRRLPLVLVVCSVLAVLALPATANAQIKPAAVKNVDEPGRTPFQYYAQAEWGEECGTNFCTLYVPVVPANQRLVITNVSGTIHLQGAAVVQNLRFYVSNPDYTVASQILLPYNPNSYPPDSISINNPRRYAVNEQILWYVEAGKRPVIDFHTTGGNIDEDWPNYFLITGYLVDLTK